MGNLTLEHLQGLVEELRVGMVPNLASSAPCRHESMQFGCVRFGSHKNFAQNKPHPLIVVSQWIGRLPEQMSMRPATSKRHGGPSVLVLPEGAIRRRKHEQFVRSYVLCTLKLRAPQDHVQSMEFLNKLDDEYLEPLKRCLEAGRR